MLATCAEFDHGTGSVAFDDGRRMPFSREVFEASGLQRLRPGQRVAVTTDGTNITSITLPL